MLLNAYIYVGVFIIIYALFFFTALILQNLAHYKDTLIMNGKQP